MARATFIARIHGVTVSSHLGHGDRFFDLRVTNDREVAESVLKPHVRSAIGGIETSWLLEAETIVYGYFPWSPSVDVDDRDARLRLLNNLLFQTRLLLKALWLTRDNAANTELGFLITPSARHSGDDVASNAISLLFSMSDGTKDVATPFTREELREAREVTRMHHPEFVSDPRHIHEEANAFRFTRALFFLEAARGTRDLSVKVANYCTCFESLFALETGELTHRLAERLARFLGTDLNSRKEIYSAVKSAYDVRSRTVHGARPETRFEKLAPISRSCDDLLRRAMRKIYETEALHRFYFTDDSSPREFSQFLLELVLA